MGREVLLPESTSTRNRILDREDEEILTPARLTTDAERKGGLMSLLKAKQEPKPEPEVTVKHTIHVKHTFTVNHRVEESAPPPPAPRPPVDGGELTPERKSEPESVTVPPSQLTAPVPQLPPPPVVVSQPWAAHYLVNLGEQIERAQRLLPKPEAITIEVPVAPVKVNPFAKKFGGK